MLVALLLEDSFGPMATPPAIAMADSESSDGAEVDFLTLPSVGPASRSATAATHGDVQASIVPVDRCSGSGDVVAVAASADDTGGTGACPSRLSQLLQGAGAMARRTPEQHWALAAHMRSARAKRSTERRLEQARRELEKAVEFFNAAGVRNQRAIVRHTPGNVLCVRALIAHGPSKGKACKIAPEALLELAYSDEHNAASTVAGIARQFHIHPRTVRRSQALMAQLYLKRQDQLLQDMAECSKRKEVSFVMWTLGWDSTLKTMTLPAHPYLMASQQRSSWHSLVSLSDITLALRHSGAQEDNGSGGDLALRSVVLVRPPIPMMSTSAECLKDALFDCPTVSDATTSAYVMLQEASR